MPKLDKEKKDCETDPNKSIYNKTMKPSLFLEENLFNQYWNFDFNG